MLMTMMGFVLAAASPDKAVPDGGESAEVYKFLGLNNWPSLLFFGIVFLFLLFWYVQIIKFNRDERAKRNKPKI